MKRGRIVALVLLSLICVAATLYGDSYAIYYASYSGQDTALVIMNSGGQDTYYTVKAYDAYGTLIDSTSGDLVAYESDYLLLSSLVGHAEDAWGLALIESPAILTVGVETSMYENWLSSDNVVDPVPTNDGEFTYFWYGLNYSNTPTQKTGIAVVNPNASPAAATLFFYDSYGDLEGSLDILLDPHETDYYLSDDVVDTAASMWGIVDVRATVPVIVAAEYFDGEGTLMNVDQLSFYYYAEY